MDNFSRNFVFLLPIICHLTEGNFESLEATLGEPHHVESHVGYPDGRYNADTDITWVIRAPQSHVIGLWTDGPFGIEEHVTCGYDRLLISCGETGEDGYLANLCGSEGLEDRIYSSSDLVIISWRTDSSEERQGFRLFYQAYPEDDVRSSRCLSDSDEEESDEDSESTESTSTRRASIAGITVGVSFIITTVFVLSVCFCCCIAAGRPFILRHRQASSAGRHTSYLGNYPLQTRSGANATVSSSNNAHTSSASTIGGVVMPTVVIDSSGQVNGNTVTQPPVLAHLPSAYLPPYEPKQESSSAPPPPAYESIVTGGSDKDTDANDAPPVYDNKGFSAENQC